MIMQYAVWAGGESHPRGVGFVFPFASEDEADAEDTSDDDEFQEDATMEEQGTEATPQPEAISTPQFLNLQRQVDKHNKEARKEMRRLVARQDHMFDAMNMSFASLNTTL